MGEEEYITKFPEVVESVKRLTIVDIERVEIECNLDDVELTLSDGSKLSVTDDHQVVHAKKKAADDDIHPVRFTNKQVRLIEHIMGHFSDYFEDECEEFFATLRKYDKKVFECFKKVKKDE